MYPLKFEPVLKQTLWGGDKIFSYKHIDKRLSNVGESWELSAIDGSETIVSNGEEKGLTLSALLKKYKEKLIGKSNYARYGDKFPLLVKFIDANKDLSIQVHPNDALATKRHGCLGKNEMWYVVEADETAKLIPGFSRHVSKEEYIEKVQDGTVIDVLQTVLVKSGDVFYVPSGRVHGIGPGVFVLEIQQTSDITYRIFDYGRKDSKGVCRELHTELAIDAINFDEVQENYRTEYIRCKNEPVQLVSTADFTTSVYDMTENIICDYSELDSFVVLNCVEGEAMLVDDENNEISLLAGETILLPATTNELKVYPCECGVKFLETYI